MGSIEVYDYKRQEWIPYIPDYDKWYQHFKDLKEGYVKPDHRGRYIVGSGSRQRRMNDQHQKPVVRLVTPVAQAVAMAKSRVKRETGRKRASVKRKIHRTSQRKRKIAKKRTKRAKKVTRRKKKGNLSSKRKRRRSQKTYHSTPKRPKRPYFDSEDQLNLTY